MLNFLAQVDLGKINPAPGTVPTAPGDPTSFVATIIRNGIWLLIVVGFVIALIWIIFAGYGFIFAGDDTKKVASSWSKIYWGLLGLVIIVGAFAIIKLAEDFFGVKIITGGLNLPILTGP